MREWHYSCILSTQYTTQNFVLHSWPLAWYCSHAVTIGISNDSYLGMLQASVNIDNILLCTHDIMHVELRWGPRNHSGSIQMVNVLSKKIPVSNLWIIVPGLYYSIHYIPLKS